MTDPAEEHSMDMVLIEGQNLPLSRSIEGSNSSDEVPVNRYQQDENENEHDNNSVINDNCPPGGEGSEVDHLKEELVLSPYYHVLRYTRSIRRSEVLGFGFISLIIMSIALHAQIGLEAVGFFVPTIGQLQQNPSIHPAHSFSWRILSEFFIPDSVSNADRECLYLNNKNHVVFQGRIINGEKGPAYRAEQFPGGLEKENLLTKLMMETARAKMSNDENDDVEDTSPLPNRTHHLGCGRARISDGWTWLCKYLVNEFMPILNLCCSTFLLSCIRCRRKKGFQFTLMMPAFLAVFLDIFQQVPTIFTYSYAGISLVEEMTESSVRGVPPLYLAPGQCCGVQSADTWMIRRRGGDFDMYPPSCCNTDTYECNNKYVRRHEVWTKGCFKDEYDRVRFYQFCSMVVLLVKLFAEMGILWCLSDLTRYDYPLPENQHNATCDVRDFEVRTKGCATIMGVTERQNMVIKINKFLPRKYEFRTQQSGACTIISVRNVDGHAGSVEIRRPRRNRNTENASVEMDRVQQRGLIFISF
ncbi:hypothetical protein Fcan01_26316 [Folsomia candida]|uniref:Uncharacterized protein n=1 Tax=Folsomia candida TaxID=158441 RepID=A0A226D3X3_FOLCA|nr:hypothetical protein Fcan01_26316 [Folsomia candida]